MSSEDHPDRPVEGSLGPIARVRVDLGVMHLDRDFDVEFLRTSDNPPKRASYAAPSGTAPATKRAKVSIPPPTQTSPDQFSYYYVPPSDQRAKKTPPSYSVLGTLARINKLAQDRNVPAKSTATTTNEGKDRSKNELVIIDDEGEDTGTKNNRNDSGTRVETETMTSEVAGEENVDIANDRNNQEQDKNSADNNGNIESEDDVAKKTSTSQDSGGEADKESDNKEPFNGERGEGNDGTDTPTNRGMDQKSQQDNDNDKDTDTGTDTHTDRDKGKKSNSVAVDSNQDGGDNKGGDEKDEEKSDVKAE